MFKRYPDIFQPCCVLPSFTGLPGWAGPWGECLCKGKGVDFPVLFSELVVIMTNVFEWPRVVIASNFKIMVSDIVIAMIL